MENFQSLATESFSYSWLTDINPIIFHESSFRKDQNFNFDIPLTDSPVSLVHADELFYDGRIMPIFVEKSKANALRINSPSVPSSPTPFKSQYFDEYYISSTKSREECSGESIGRFYNQKEYGSYGKWRKLSKRILKKCFGIFKPIFETIGCSRKNIRVNNLDRKYSEIKSWSNSLQASPRLSSAYSPRQSPSRSSSVEQYDAENSIKEAILYCKRSIGE